MDMKYIDEYRDKKLIGKVARQIHEAADTRRTYRFMEVCGTHTMTIFRFGLKEMLPWNIELISGPGCPVCVTPNEFIDKAIAIAAMKNVIIATFGDMLRVPGSYSSLEKEKAAGAAVRIVYSTTDALNIAQKNPNKDVVFLGIGFETTAPTVGQSILAAKRNGIGNYSVLCGHKTMPEALKALVSDKPAIDGFLLPGHVSAVIGVEPYMFLAKQYSKRCVITGFEPLDIMQAILMLITQKNPKVEVQYTRIISNDGNKIARNVIRTVFRKTDSIWRGIGRVKNSGLAVCDAYSDLDAGQKYKLRIGPSRDNKNCICGDILKGAKVPLDCSIFAKVCTPEHPIGACMVSSEGACAAYYKYHRHR